MGQIQDLVERGQTAPVLEVLVQERVEAQVQVLALVGTGLPVQVPGVEGCMFL